MQTSPFGPLNSICGFRPPLNWSEVKSGRFLRLSRNLGGWPSVVGMGRFTSVVKHAPGGINRWSSRADCGTPSMYIRFRHASDTNRPFWAAEIRLVE